MQDSLEHGGGAGTTTGRGAARAPFPWPPPEGGGILTALGETWRGATFEPGPFFARVPRTGGTGPAVLYYLVVGILVAGATLFWTVLARLGTAPAEGTLAAELGVRTMEPLTRFLLSPLALLGALALSAAVIHVLLVLMGGARHGPGTTVRVLCYAYSPMLAAVVPVLGALVGTVWMGVVAVVGLREAHEVPGWKAALAVLLPFLIILGLLGVVILAILAAGAAVLTGGP